MPIKAANKPASPEKPNSKLTRPNLKTLFLTVGSSLDRKDAEGKPATVEIVLPPTMKSPLIVILPDPQHPTGLRVIALDDSRTGFPWGSLRLFNASAISLMIHYGSEEKALTDGDLPVDIIPEDQRVKK